MQFINQPDAENEEAWWDRFKALLDDQNEWPTQYTFKFIAPSGRVEELKEIFGDHPVQVRESSEGNYKSVTAHLHMSSSEEVIDVYERASGIEDVIAL